MSPTDRNKILIAGGVALIAIIVVVFVLLRGRRPAQQEAGPGTGAFTPTAQAPAGPPAPGAAAPAAPAAPGSEEVEAPAGAARVGVVQMGRGPAELTRDDPFETFEPPLMPPPAELVVNLPPVNLQPGGLRPVGPSQVVTVGRRRVAGVLFNERPWAILEEQNETFVVKPGDVVDGLRITAIARDSIFLVDPEGRRWQVPLRGVAPGSERPSSAVSRTEAMPEMPPASP